MKFKTEIKINTITEFPKLLRNEKNKEVNIIAQIIGEEKDEKKREPFELCCILDKSGSMSGEKLRWSKRAVRKLIKHLDPDLGDIFHFITYDSTIQVVFENADLSSKEKLEDKVKKIEASGCTNISGALERANKILKSGYSKKGMIQRIFLFSDGHANEGIRSKPGMFKLVENIFKEGITTSSFGIGNNYDEEMMKGIAKIGNGKYFFLEEEKITAQVSKAIHGLMKLVGTEAKIEFKPLNGSKILKIYGRDSVKERIIGDVFGGNKKNIMMKIQTNTTTKDDTLNMVEYTLTYKSKTIKKEVKLSGVLSIGVTDTKEFTVDKSSEIIVSLQIQEMAERNKKILDLINSNKIEEAIEEKEKLIIDLEKCKDLDETDKIKNAIIKCKVDIQNLKDSKIEKTKLAIDECVCECESDDDMGLGLFGDDSDDDMDD